MDVKIEEDRIIVRFIPLSREYSYPSTYSLNEALLSAYAAAESEYVMDEISGRISLRYTKQDFTSTYAEMFLAIQKQPNWLNIKPLFHVTRKQRSVPLRPPSDGMKAMTADYQSYLEQAAKRSNLPVPVGMTYRLFGSNEHSDSFVKQGKDNLTPEKFVHSYTKYGKAVKDLPNPSTALSTYLAKGYILLQQAMGMRKYKGKIKFDFEISEIDDIRLNTTSSGMRAGLDFVMDLGGVKVRVVVNGTKALQAFYASDLAEKILEMILRGESLQVIKTYVDQAWKIEFKDEIIAKIAKNAAEAHAFNLKVRDFFIPSTVSYLLAYIAQKDRQVFERGNIIKIGHKWWHGGAQHIAEFVKANDPDMCFDDADFNALDTTLHRTLLDMYSASALFYYDQTHSGYNFIRNLVKMTGELLSVKHTHLHGNVWRTIVGGMPSGAFQTSHGDSWCVAVLWYSFVAFTMGQYPQLAAKIAKALEAGRIGIVVYGDDAIYFYDRMFKHVLNLNLFSKWLEFNFDMLLRDVRVDIPFFSVPDQFGECTEGVVFLKRHFVLTPPNLKKKYPGIADVLPYRGVKSAEAKLVYGSTSSRKTVQCELLGLVGAAYDTFGTNVVLHHFIRNAFERITVIRKDITFEDILASDSGKLKKLTARLGISLDEITHSFPTIDDLMKRHIYQAPISKPVMSYKLANIREMGFVGACFL